MLFILVLTESARWLSGVRSSSVELREPSQHHQLPDDRVSQCQCSSVSQWSVVNWMFSPDVALISNYKVRQQDSERNVQLSCCPVVTCWVSGGFLQHQRILHISAQPDRRPAVGLHCGADLVFVWYWASTLHNSDQHLGLSCRYVETLHFHITWLVFWIVTVNINRIV